MLIRSHRAIFSSCGKVYKKEFLSSWLIRSPFTWNLYTLYRTFSIFVIASLYCEFQILMQYSMCDWTYNWHILPTHKTSADPINFPIRFHTDWVNLLVKFEVMCYYYVQILNFICRFARSNLHWYDVKAFANLLDFCDCTGCDEILLSSLSVAIYHISLAVFRC